MKKIVALTIMIGMVLLITGCQPAEKIVEKIVEKEVPKIVEVEKEPIEIPTKITMSTVDTYLDRENIQLIDLRDLDDKFKSGYIEGFTMIPFFDYLENYALYRADGDWQFDANEDVTDIGPLVLNSLFDKRADAILLMCGSGTRAGYVKSALESMGYTNVLNVGGFKDYNGSNKVLGDGEYVDKYLPSEISMDNIDEYLDLKGVQYVDLRNFSDKYSAGYIRGFETISFFEYLEGEGYLVRSDNNWDFASEDLRDEIILENFFDESARAIVLMCGSGTRAAYVKTALESIGYSSVYNAGGFKDYDGSRFVAGDGEFSIAAS